ncbi:MAG: outer membrane lipoprotein-sorting protein [Saprospiraceae bacterium]|nr:outer membrane lipoprotein-sorting protein [Saprospiraceae bacterium]
MNLKKSLLLLCVAFCSHLLTAQSADEIVNKYFENTGGRAAWSKISSMKSTAKIKAQGMEFPTVIMAKPMKTKIALTFQGMTIVQPAFDGNIGWQTNFLTMKAEKMETEDSEIMKAEYGDFPDPLLNYKDKGYTISLEGSETVEGTDCFKIKLTKKPIKIDGKDEENITTYFFDKENFVPIMTRSMMKKGQGKGLNSESVFSDYQEVNGLMMPFNLGQKFDGQLQASIAIEKIEFNVDIDDKEFAFPEEK